MAVPLARKGLESVRESFAAAEVRGESLACLLIHTEITGEEEHRTDNRPPAHQRFGSNAVHRSVSGYRTKGIFQPEGDLGSDSFSEVFHGIEFAGSDRAYELFRRLSNETGQCLDALPEHLLSLFAPETRQTLDPGRQWLYCVFELAWKRPAGSTLPEARRRAWRGDSSVSLDKLDSGEWPELAAEFPRHRWFAEIEELFSASRSAIDALLYLWDAECTDGSRSLSSSTGDSKSLVAAPDPVKSLTKRKKASKRSWKDGPPPKDWHPHHIEGTLATLALVVKVDEATLSKNNGNAYWVWKRNRTTFRLYAKSDRDFSLWNERYLKSEDGAKPTKTDQNR